MRSVPSLIPLALAAALVSAPDAARAFEPFTGVVISQRLLDRDGSPLLTGNFSPDGNLATPTWRICAPDCGAVAATNQTLKPGPTAAGTTFEASATVDGVTYTAKTPVWQGAVSSTTPPALAGAVKPGGTVTPSPATWTGGWGDEFSQLGVRACPTADGAGNCRLLAETTSTGQPATVKISGAYGGWRIGAVDVRYGYGSIFGGPAYQWATNTISPLSAPDPGPTVAVGPLSAPLPGVVQELPKFVEGGNRPTGSLRLRTKAKRSNHELVLGTVKCQAKCSAKVTVQQGARKLTQRLSAGDTIRVDASAFEGSARLKVSLLIAGDAASAQHGFVARR